MAQVRSRRDARPQEAEGDGASEEKGRDRLSVSLSPRDRRRLSDLAEELHLSRNDVVRRALAVEHYLRQHLREGRKILIEDEDGRLRQVEFVQ